MRKEIITVLKGLAFKIVEDEIEGLPTNSEYIRAYKILRKLLPPTKAQIRRMTLDVITKALREKDIKGAEKIAEELAENIVKGLLDDLNKLEECDRLFI